MNKKTGQTGESLACDFLNGQGYKILFRNIRCLYGEIDIVAFKDQIIHFVEVKTRKSLLFGLPIESYTPIKRERILKTGFWILHESNLELPFFKRFQFDFMGYILDLNNNILQQNWLENAWD